MEAQQVSEAESAREQLQDLQDQIAGHKASKQELEAELDRQKQVRTLDWRLPAKTLSAGCHVGGASGEASYWRSYGTGPEAEGRPGAGSSCLVTVPQSSFVLTAGR